MLKRGLLTTLAFNCLAAVLIPHLVSAAGDSAVPATTSYQLPTTDAVGISLAPDVQGTSYPSDQQILEALRSIGNKQKETLSVNSGQVSDKKILPITVPINSETTPDQLRSLSLALVQNSYLPVLLVSDGGVATPSGSLTGLADRLNGVGWNNKPVLVLGTEPLVEEGLNPYGLGGLGSAQERALVYKENFLEFAEAIDHNKYTLIPATLLMRSSEMESWVQSNKGIYDDAPVIGLYANHFDSKNDQKMIERLKKDFPNKEMFISSFSLDTSTTYQQQLNNLKEVSVPAGVKFVNVAVPNHCSQTPLYFFWQGSIYSQSGGTIWNECWESLSIQKEESVGVSSVGRLLSAGFEAAIILAVLFVFGQLIVAGYGWIMAGGDKSKIDSARGRITNALIGLTIVAAAWALIKVIGLFFGVDITNIVIPSATGTLL